MADVKLVIRTADRSRKAEIVVSDAQTCSEVIQAAVDNWALPKDSEYTLVNVTKDPPQTLDPAQNLAKAGVSDGEVLEIQPVLVAGV